MHVPIGKNWRDCVRIRQVNRPSDPRKAAWRDDSVARPLHHYQIINLVHAVACPQYLHLNLWNSSPSIAYVFQLWEMSRENNCLKSGWTSDLETGPTRNAETDFLLSRCCKDVRHPMERALLTCVSMRQMFVPISDAIDVAVPHSSLAWMLAPVSRLSAQLHIHMMSLVRRRMSFKVN